MYHSERNELGMPELLDPLVKIDFEIQIGYHRGFIMD